MKSKNEKISKVNTLNSSETDSDKMTDDFELNVKDEVNNEFNILDAFVSKKQNNMREKRTTTDSRYSDDSGCMEELISFLYKFWF